jgi:hypothetical protein
MNRQFNDGTKNIPKNNVMCKSNNLNRIFYFECDLFAIKIYQSIDQWKR